MFNFGPLGLRCRGLLDGTSGARCGRSQGQQQGRCWTIGGGMISSGSAVCGGGAGWGGGGRMYVLLGRCKSFGGGGGGSLARMRYLGTSRTRSRMTGRSMTISRLGCGVEDERMIPGGTPGPQRTGLSNILSKTEIKEICNFTSLVSIPTSCGLSARSSYSWYRYTRSLRWYRREPASFCRFPEKTTSFRGGGSRLLCLHRHPSSSGLVSLSRVRKGRQCRDGAAATGDSGVARRLPALAASGMEYIVCEHAANATVSPRIDVPHVRRFDGASGHAHAPRNGGARGGGQ